jgi:uncharacterized protein
MTVTGTPLRLDTEACDGCGRCVRECRARALKVGPGYIYVDWNRCDGCGACVDRCDRGAIVRRRVTSATKAAAPKVAAEVPARGLASWFRRRETQAEAQPGATGAASPKVAAPAWSGPEAVLVIVVAFALLIGIQALVGSASREPVGAGLTLLAYDGVLAALLAFLALRRRLGVATAFRLDVMPEWHSMLLAGALALGTWAFSLTYRVTALYLGAQPPAAEGPELTTLFGPGLLGAAITVFVVVILGPLVEEAALRGVVLGALRDRLGPWPAIFVSAFAFSLLHASAWSFLPLTVLGLSLGWLAQRGRSLLPAVVLHMAYNAVFVASALYVAGHI